MKVSMNPLVFVFVILELSSFNVDCQVEPVAPYITFRGIVLQNHSYIDFYQIGNSIIDGVQCHTDLTTCCNSSYGSHGGRWFSYATGSTLESYSSYYYYDYYGNALYQQEFDQGLAILSDSRSYYSNGLYRCDIDTNASTDGDRNDTDVSRRESVYVGIYSYGGNLQLESNSYIVLNGSNVPREVTVTVNSVDPLLVTLTCITTGGPATNVTWTRDSEEIEGGVTVLESGASARYRHTLYNVTEGVYNCTVWNNKPSVVTAEVNVAVPSPPSNLSVTHHSLTSVNVSWSPAPQDDVDIDGYIIYYQLVAGGSKRTHQTESTATSTIFSLEQGGEYSFSMVSTYNGIPSTEIGPLNISIVIPPPSNLSVTQLSLTSVNVSWSPAPQDDVDIIYYGYIIYYQLVARGSNTTHQTESTATSTIIRSLEQGGEYSFSVVSTNNEIPSIEIGPLNISLVESVNTSVEISRDAPFYVGTSLNLTCKVDLPNTVDPKIIRHVNFMKNNKYDPLPDHINFHPLRLHHRGTYQCRICLVIRDGRSSVTCSVGNETHNISVLALPPPEMKISVEPLATVGSVRAINCSVSVVPHLITSPHVELYGPDQHLLASGNTNSSLIHTLDPVKSLNAGVYECNGVLQINSANIYFDFQSFIHLSVQLPQPHVTITASPRKTLTSGYPVTLTCTAILSPHIDAVGAISLSWGGPRMILSNKPYSVIESGFGLRYTSSLAMSDIQSQDEGVYTCTVRVAGDRDILGNVVTESITVRVRGSRPGSPTSGFPTRGRG